MKNNSFDVIRLILVFLVIFNHAEVYSFAKDNLTLFAQKLAVFPIRDFDENELKIGTVGVYGFFVISGFLISASWERSQNILDFVKKRFFRIYPGFLVSLIVCAFVFFPIIYFLDFGNFSNFYPDSWIHMWEYFFRNLGVENVKPKMPTLKFLVEKDYYFNGPYWSLIHELRAYFMVLVLGIIGFSKSRKNILILAVVLNLIYIVGVLRPDFRNFMDLVFSNFRLFILFSYFAVGMTFFRYLDKIKWNWAFFGLAIFGIFAGFQLNILALFGPVCYTYILLFLSQVLPLKNLAKKVGDMSYGAYLYSWPIQIMFTYTNLDTIGYFGFTIISFLIACICGYLSWHLVEKKFLVRYRQSA
jgi:peptidoglycan/LPS O-acetylase OafA/YrhL